MILPYIGSCLNAQIVEFFESLEFLKTLECNTQWSISL